MLAKSKSHIYIQTDLFGSFCMNSSGNADTCVLFTFFTQCGVARFLASDFLSTAHTAKICEN
jgi:hypothetical protein